MAEVTGEIQHCYSRLGEKNKWQDYIAGLVGRHSYLAYLQHNQIEQQLKAVATSELRYHCEECGLTSRNLFWQCPGCQNWSSIKPLAHRHGARESALWGTL